MKSHSARKNASGRFVLRLDPSLHARLRRNAHVAAISLNELCSRKLASPDFRIGTAPAVDLEGAVSRAQSICGDSLIGVVVFGSWARGEAADGSDLDLLIVIEEQLALSRGLYRTWDHSEAVSAGTSTDISMEPQFVHLPGPEETVAGLWAEVAIDGIVIFERNLRISRRLIRVRQDIAAGRIERRSLHGQAYWVRNEVA